MYSFTEKLVGTSLAFIIFVAGLAILTALIDDWTAPNKALMAKTCFETEGKWVHIAKNEYTCIYKKAEHENSN